MASDGFAPLLLPSESPIIFYNTPEPDRVGELNVKNITIVGPQSNTNSPFLKMFQLQGTICDGLMASATVLAQVKVMLLSTSLPPPSMAKKCSSAVLMFKTAFSNEVAHQASLLLMTQEFEPELLIGPPTFPCLQVLSSKLDLPFVSFIPSGPIDPISDTLWRGFNPRAALPNPLSYVPQVGMALGSQHLVS